MEFSVWAKQHQFFIDLSKRIWLSKRNVYYPKLIWIIWTSTTNQWLHLVHHQWEQSLRYHPTKLQYFAWECLYLSGDGQPGVNLTILGDSSKKLVHLEKFKIFAPLKGSNFLEQSQTNWLEKIEFRSAQQPSLMLWIRETGNVGCQMKRPISSTSRHFQRVAVSMSVA